MARWTARAALRRMSCRIEDAKAALIDIAGIWGDIDQRCCDRVDELIGDLDALMRDQVEFVDEKEAAGEEIGL